MTTRFEDRLSALERRRVPPPALPDGLKLSEVSHTAVDVLEVVCRAWPAPDDPLAPGLCASVVAALERPPAERVVAVGMVLGKFYHQLVEEHRARGAARARRQPGRSAAL